MIWRMWRCLSRKKLDFLKASCNAAIARAFIVPMIMLVEFVTVTWGLEWRQVDGVHTPEKIPYKVVSVEPRSANAGGGQNKTVSRGVWGCYHLAQFFHQYPSYTTLLHSHDISRVKPRLMDLFGRLDKCIPRTPKTGLLVSRGVRLLFLTVPQILQ